MKKFLFLVLVGCIAGTASSQMKMPISWDYKANVINGCEAELVITAKVDSGWHLYSQKYDPNPLFFEFKNSKEYANDGGVSEPTPVKEYDDLMGWDLYYFKESIVVFKQKIKIVPNGNKRVSITGTIMGQVCSYDSGVCMPLNHTFSFDIAGCN